MAAQRVADMTRDDLTAFVEDVVDRRLQVLLKPRDAHCRRDLESIDRNMDTAARNALDTGAIKRRPGSVNHD
jgi:hypothetical protein